MSTTTDSQPIIHLPTKLILISTKAYFSPSRTIDYLTTLLSPSTSIFPLPPDLLFAFIPDFLTLHPCSQLLSSHTSTSSHESATTPDHPQSWPLHLGVQDCSPHASYGAHTGSIVPPALQSLGITIVELGHAERRRPPLSESDSVVAEKAKVVSDHNMVPLVCIGEPSPPPKNGPLSMAVGNAMRQLRPQIESVLEVVDGAKPVILAYEPVWAIGAEKPAGVEFVGAVVQGIREVVKGFEGNGRRGQTKVVYGGSAGPGLWSGQGTGQEGLGEYVDGMFLGRFAHEVQGVKKVVDEVLSSMGHEVKKA